MVDGSYDLRIMESIALLNHEIGYHYEDIDNALYFLEIKE